MTKSFAAQEVNEHNFFARLEILARPYAKKEPGQRKIIIDLNLDSDSLAHCFRQFRRTKAAIPTL